MATRRFGSTISRPAPANAVAPKRPIPNRCGGPTEKRSSACSRPGTIRGTSGSYPLDGGRERASETLPPDLDVRKMARPELMRFTSFDSREITGYLYVPEFATADKPVPLLVTPHGGPTSHTITKQCPISKFQVRNKNCYASTAPPVVNLNLVFEICLSLACPHSIAEGYLGYWLFINRVLPSPAIRRSGRPRKMTLSR